MRHMFTFWIMAKYFVETFPVLFPSSASLCSFFYKLTDIHLNVFMSENIQATSNFPYYLDKYVCSGIFISVDSFSFIFLFDLNTNMTKHLTYCDICLVNGAVWVSL